MSVRALNWVLDHSPAEASARLVLISLANHASGDGGDAYPSIETIRREANLKSRRTVQNAIRKLIDDGGIEVQEQPGPKGQGRYRVLLAEGGANDDRGVQSTTGGGAIDDTKGVQSTTGGGAIDDSRVYEPSLEPTTKPSIDTVLFSEWQQIFDKRDTKLSPARRKAVKTALEEEPDVEVLKQALHGFKVHRQRKPGPVELGDIFTTFRGSGDLRSRIEWLRSLASGDSGERMDPEKKARLIEDIRYTLSLPHRPERERAQRAREQLLAAGYKVNRVPGPIFVEVTL